MEEEEYEALLISQDGKCAICGRSEADSKKNFLCVDHIEGTLQVRGLLCSFCNSAIGLLAHDTDRLLTAAAYLERPPVFVGRRVPQGIHRQAA
jgi:hypothetical protein